MSSGCNFDKVPVVMGTAPKMLPNKSVYVLVLDQIASHILSIEGSRIPIILTKKAPHSDVSP